MKEQKISSKDVAREAGVSQATVSYVLNNVKGIKIKPETKEAVIVAAKKLNYYPNLIARSMRIKKSMSIGVVSDKNISNFMFVQVLEGIKNALVPKNYSIMLCFDKWQDIEVAEHIKYFGSNRIDGIVFAFANVSDEHYSFLMDNNIPFVVIHSNANNDMINLVKTDMNNAVTSAVEHLKTRGKKKIAFFGVSAGNDNDRRYNGYVKALENCGVRVDPELVLKTSGSDEELEEQFEQFFADQKVIPCAVLCETTNLGFHLLKYAARKKIRVPEELAVVAIGTSRFSHLSYPALSAIESPLYDMGFTGCEMLFNIMDGNVANNVVVLEWVFTPRDSS